MDFQDDHKQQPHVAKNCPLSEYFFEDFGSKNNIYDQLKSMIYDLKDSLLKACDDDPGVLQDFANDVIRLFNFPDFIKICADMHFRNFMDIGLNMAIDMDSYKNEYQPFQRWEILHPDISFLTSLLNAKYSLLVTRGILSVIFGYWYNDALCKKVRGGIYASHLQDEQLPTLYRNLKIFPFEIVDDSIGSTPSVEVLQNLLFSMFPADKAQMTQQDDFLLMSKRKASPNALDADDTPDHKRIQFTGELASESSYCQDFPAVSEVVEILPVELEMEDTEDLESFPSCLPHIKINSTVIEYFFEEPHTRVLAEKVNDRPTLKAMIYDLKDALQRSPLLNVCDGGDALQDFVSKAHDLFNHKEFIQAFVETYFNDQEWCTDVIYDLQVYRIEKDHIGLLETLQHDASFLTNVFKTKHCALVTRGVLSVIYGGCCDAALVKGVRSGVNDASLTRKITCTHHTEFCLEKICCISVPASVEVLKESLSLILPPDKAEIIYRQVEGYKEDYKNKKGDPYGASGIMIWRPDRKFYVFDLRCIIPDRCWSCS